VQVVSRKEFDSIEAFSDRIFSICEQAGAEMVCLGGWLSLLRIPEQWIGRVLNIHPALLPKFGGKGMWGHHVHEAVLAAGEKTSGCTVHFVNNEYDAGPIILQRTCPVLADDTPDTLAARVFEEEKRAYPDAIDLVRTGRVRLVGQRIVPA
jgi:phosphoribosylglycinamide formyltransferase 1